MSGETCPRCHEGQANEIPYLTIWPCGTRQYHGSGFIEESARCVRRQTAQDHNPAEAAKQQGVGREDADGDDYTAYQEPMKPLRPDETC